MASSGVLKMISRGVVPAAAGGALLTPEESEATFGGITAKGAKHIIADAARLEARGASREEIWQKSFELHQRGAFKGGDGLWRVEFNDYASQLQYPNGFERLNDVLKGTEIGSQYNFDDTLVKTTDDMPFGGSFTPGLFPKIEIPRLESPMDEASAMSVGNKWGFDTVNEIKADITKQNQEAKRTLIHETQHRVQQEEGFAPGSNPGAAGGYSNYARTAGEVEARNVETRMDMPAGVKFELPPWLTEDIAEDRPRIYLGGERQAIAKKKQAAFLASIGLSAGAMAGEEPPEIDDPEVADFVANARDQGFTDEEISLYLEDAFEGEPVKEPLAAQQAPLTPEEIEEIYKNGEATSAEVGQYEALIYKPDYDNITADQFATPSETYDPAKQNIPEVDEDGRYTGGLTSVIPELSESEIRKYAKELQVDPTKTSGINAVYSQARREKMIRDTKSLASALSELNNTARPWMWMKSTFNNEAELEYNRLREHGNQVVVEELRERGLTARFDKTSGTFQAQDHEGQWQHVTPGFLESMGAEKFELTGSILGGVSGAGAMKYLRKGGLKAQLLGGAAGALAGAILGDQVDYVTAAIETQEELDAQVMAERAMGSGSETILWEIAGAGLMKIGSYGWKGVRHAYRSMKDGNTQGAYEALKQSLGDISDEQVQEIITRWEKLNERTAPTSKRLLPRGEKTTFQEQALAIGPTTSAGGEEVVGISTKIDPQASAAVASEINKRAQDVLRLARENRPENTGQRLVQALDKYVTEVKTNFDVVKSAGEDLVPSDFAFNLQRLTIKPLIESKMNTIKDPAKIDSLARVLYKVDNAAQTRSFNDLLDLRVTINDFKFNRRIVNKQDYDAINETLANIDSQIDTAMRSSKEGTQWLADWKDANKEYAKYAQLRKGTLWKAVTKPGKSESAIAKNLLTYGKPIDSTFEDVMDKLPIKVRADVESAMVDQLVNKFTKGKPGEFRAIGFPSLAEELKEYNLTTPAAGRMKKAIERMAQVYQNDIRLSAAAGKITVPGFQSYLTDDPLMRIKMAGMSEAFNYVRRLLPGNKSDALAMASKVAKLLEEPLNTKTVDQVMKTIQEEEGLTAAIKRLQSATAREQAKQGGTPYKVKLFKDKSGKLYTSDGPGRAAMSETLPIHRIAPEEEALRILGEAKLNSSTLTRINKMKLVEAGFLKVKTKDGQLIDLGADYEF